jgi:hypothetical protein
MGSGLRKSDIGKSMWQLVISLEVIDRNAIPFPIETQARLPM